jgi:hypothetical protein
MPLPPWVIEELDSERARREEQDRARSQRIELPQTPAVDVVDAGKETEVSAPVGVVILDISPVEISPLARNRIDL